ncbi:MAG: rhodanese-like domain-containing protein [Vicingaceae bacterium]
MKFLNLEAKAFQEKLQKNQNARLIDVREAYEYEDFNIGGTNIPMSEVLSRTEEFANCQEILICCASGKRSAVVAHHLARRLPQTKIYSLTGGLTAFQTEEAS